ncbi:MAG: 23S rRNA (pseudouridine(1915)-N(3))-methyltransferase RlmH [Pseudomonadota bacterium]
MRITLSVIGRAKAGVHQDLYQHYVGRLSWPIALRELEVRRALDDGKRKGAEGELLLGAIPQDARLIALDERGKNLSSPQFARLLADWRDDGFAHIAFAIGGADGLDHRVLEAAHFRLAFGAATWPHMLVRGLLAEQLYRAQSILTGHPYHRA